MAFDYYDVDTYHASGIVYSIHTYGYRLHCPRLHVQAHDQAHIHMHTHWHSINRILFPVELQINECTSGWLIAISNEGDNETVA